MDMPPVQDMETVTAAPPHQQKQIDTLNAETVTPSDESLDDRLNQAEALWEHGTRLYDEYQIPSAVIELKKSLEMMPADLHEGWQLCLFSRASNSAYILSGTSKHLDDAILFQEACLNTTKDEPTRRDCLIMLSEQLFSRYNKTGLTMEMIYLMGSKMNARGGYVATEEQSSPFKALKIRYTGRRIRELLKSDIRKAIQACQEGLDLTSADDQDRPDTIYHLGALYLAQYKENLSLEDLEHAISLFRESLAVQPKPVRPSRHRVARVLVDEYANTGLPAHVEEAIQCLRQVIDSQIRPSPYLAVDLATSLFSQYRNTGNIGHLNAALREATKETNDDKYSLSMLSIPHLLLLGDLYLERYNRRELGRDLEQSIKITEVLKDLFQTAREKFSQGETPMLGDSFAKRWSENAQAKFDRDEFTIDFLMHPFLPTDGVSLIDILDRLEALFKRQYQVKQGSISLHSAINIQKEICNLVPTKIASFRLGSDLLKLFWLMRDTISLGESWRTLKDSVPKEALDIFRELTPRASDSFEAALYSQGLVMSLVYEYQVTGDAKLLDEAIDVGANARQRLPDRKKYQGMLSACLAEAYSCKYYLSEDSSDLDIVIQLSNDSLRVKSKDKSHRAWLLSQVSQAYVQKYSRTNAMQDIDLAVRFGWRAMNLVPERCLEHELISVRVAATLHKRYRSLNTQSDLDMALGLMKAICTEGPNYSLNRSLKYSATYASLLCENHKVTGSVGDLSEAFRISHYYGHMAKAPRACYFGQQEVFVPLDERSTEEMVQKLRNLMASSDHQENRPRYMSCLGLALRYRLLFKGSKEDFYEALQLSRDAIDATPSHNEDRSWHLCCLSQILLCDNGLSPQEQASGNVEALSLAEEALRVAAPDHPGRAFYMVVLSQIFHKRYQRTSHLPDLYQAIQVALEALEVTGGCSIADRSLRRECLGYLKIYLADRFLRHGDTRDLENISQLEIDFQRCGISHQQLADFEARNGHDVLYHLHLRTGQKEPVQTSLAYGEHMFMRLPAVWECADRLHKLAVSISSPQHSLRAVDFDGLIDIYEILKNELPNTHIQRPIIFYQSGQCYKDRYLIDSSHGMEGQDCEKLLNDLERAKTDIHQFMDMAEEKNQLWIMALYGLGILYAEKFSYVWEAKDLKYALEVHQECIRITSTKHPEYPFMLINLARTRLFRYNLFGETSDLVRSLELLREGLTVAPQGSEIHRRLIVNLLLTSGELYKASRCDKDFDATLQLHADYMDASGSEHSLCEMLWRKGLLYLQKHRGLGALGDLEEAENCFRESLEHGRSGINFPAQFGIAQCHRLRFEGGGPITHLELALQTLHNVGNVTAADQTDYPIIFAELGYCYIKRFEMTASPLDLDEAISHYRSALESRWGGPQERMSVRNALLQAYIQAKDWSEAHKLISQTIYQLDSYAPRCLSTLEGQAVLGKLGGLASKAAAVALDFGNHPQDALGSYENARGIIASLTNEARLNVETIRGVDPSLKNELASLRSKLAAKNRANLDFKGKMDYIAASFEFDSWLAKAEDSRPSLRYPVKLSLETISPAAISEHGNTVVVNVSHRCDAFIISYEVRAIPLPNLLEGDVKERAQRGDYGSNENLEWLWDCIARPILDALGFTGPPENQDWPRVWWLTTGLLSRFPLHAAGRHAERSNNTVIDRVVSSYSQSISSQWETTLRGSTYTPTKALLVAMEKTPGSFSLPFATTEINTVKELFGKMSIDSVEPERLRESVISHLNDCHIFHFAGHGYTDPQAPLQSHLRLKDWKQMPLRVEDLLEVSLREHPPFLAYLSACGTSQITDKRYLDESIHLISACQLAGFRHVIGTLWQVNDETCVDVARITYEVMNEHSMADYSVSLGLHTAARELRDRWLDGALKSGIRTAWSKSESRDCQGSNESDSMDLPLQRDVKRRGERLKTGLWVPYVHYGL